MVSLDDLAALFQVAVREDALVGGVTIGYKGRTVILTAGQALASAGGRLVSLPAPPVKDGRRWLVPVEFLNRALGPIYDVKLDVRKNSRLVLVGDVRVPRVSVRQEPSGAQTRVTLRDQPQGALHDLAGARPRARALRGRRPRRRAAGVLPAPAASVDPPLGIRPDDRARRRPALRVVSRLARGPGRGRRAADRGPVAGRSGTGSSRTRAEAPRRCPFRRRRTSSRRPRSRRPARSARS